MQLITIENKKVSRTIAVLIFILEIHLISGVFVLGWWYGYTKCIYHPFPICFFRTIYLVPLKLLVQYIKKNYLHC